MNDSKNHGAGTAPPSDAKPRPKGGVETPVGSALEPKAAWNRPTVRIIDTERKSSGDGDTNIRESGPYGVSSGDPA